MALGKWDTSTIGKLVRRERYCQRAFMYADHLHDEGDGPHGGVFTCSICGESWYYETEEE